MTVKSLLFICYGLTSVLCIWDERFESSVGVNRIVAASNLGSNRGKKPFPEETKPACYDRTGRCFKRIIRAKFYIQDELYHMLEMSNRANFQPFSIDKLIKARLDAMLFGINQKLDMLDNGGYELSYYEAEPFSLLSESDVQMKNTYSDRLDNNKRKTLDLKNVFAVSFAFQEAVQESLPNQNAKAPPHIRIVIRIGDKKLTCATEEKCICNQDWKYACVSVLSVLPEHWKGFENSTRGLGHPVYAHEIGHALGYDTHDDLIYNDPRNYLIMNASVFHRAFRWSPEAMQAIRQQYDKYHRVCLATKEVKPEPPRTTNPPRKLRCTFYGVPAKCPPSFYG